MYGNTSTKTRVRGHIQVTVREKMDQFVDAPNPNKRPPDSQKEKKVHFLTMLQNERTAMSHGNQNVAAAAAAICDGKALRLLYGIK
jgi:hypothetical protein